MRSFFDRLKEMEFPHTYVIVLTLVIVAVALTYIIPAGEYGMIEDPETGETTIIADDFKYIENTPVSPLKIPSKIIEGLNASSSLIFLVLIIGGSFQVIISTGLFQAFTSQLTNKFAGKENIIIPAFTTIFALTCTTQTVSTFIGFVPITVVIARSMGYDAIVGVSMVLLGAAVGFSTGTLNPFTTGVAQDIAELPMYSGLGLRAASLVIFLIVTNIYLIRYANKVKANKELSLVYDLEQEEYDAELALDEEVEVETRHYLVLLVLLASMATLIYGGMKLDWGTDQNAALFIVMGVFGGLVGGMGPSKIANEFLDGLRNLVFGAIIIGIARSIAIILTEGNIMNTVVYGLSNVLMILPAPLRVVGMFIAQTIINVFIGSGSGQAAVTMPIMIPVADIVGMTRQSAVLAFNFGDGFSNYILPTSSALMGYLAIANIPYEKWMQFMGKLYGIFAIVGSIILLFSYYIGYGPF